MSFGGWKSSFRTSISTTSAPNERSAFETPRPVASETSRSNPGPPMSTAIFWPEISDVMTSPSSVARPQSCRFSHDFNFRLQLDPTLCARGRFDLVNQLKHFRCGRAAIVDDEIAVKLGDASNSHARMVQPYLFDKFPLRSI